MFDRRCVICVLNIPKGSTLAALRNDRFAIKTAPLSKVSVVQLTRLKGNRIIADAEDNRMLGSFRHTGASGLVWSKGSRKHAIDASGFGIAGAVDGGDQVTVGVTPGMQIG